LAEYMFVCPECGFKAPLNPRITQCPKCGAPLRIELIGGGFTPLRGRGVWRYKGVMPNPLHVDNPISLGEGGTPLVRRRINGIDVWFKLEYLNPLGSFKDRGVSVAATLAKSLGYSTLVEDSSGNTGLSTAGYAAASGMKARIYVPADAPEGKKKLVRLLGAELIEAPSRSDAARLAEEQLRSGEYHVAHTWNPWFIEGTVTIAYEVSEDLSWTVPSTIIAPVASGTLLLGIYYGFKRLRKLGVVEDESPRIIGVQALGTTPVYKAIHGESPQGYSRLIDALRIPNPPRLKEIVEAIERSRGDVIIVGDDEVKPALKELAHMGFIVEPTSASAYAAFKKAFSEGLVERGDSVLIPLTGTGFKTLDILLEVVSGQ